MGDEAVRTEAIPGLVVTIGLPPAPLRANAGALAPPHAKIRAVGRYRWEARIEGLKACRAAGLAKAPRWREARIAPCFTWPSRRNFCDPDNLIYSLKAAIDGLRDAGILANDDRLEWVTPEQLAAENGPDRRATKHSIPGVAIYVTPLGGAGGQ